MESATSWFILFIYKCVTKVFSEKELRHKPGQCHLKKCWLTENQHGDKMYNNTSKEYLKNAILLIINII